jgi:hypothetical protein
MTFLQVARLFDNLYAIDQPERMHISTILYSNLDFVGTRAMINSSVTAVPTTEQSSTGILKQLEVFYQI